ncbi:MAG: hypothetical protein AABN34_14010 [Acidobacteriota bacterium]
MSIKLTISVTEEPGSCDEVDSGGAVKQVKELTIALNDLKERHKDLVDQMGDHIAPFPDAMVGAYMSHFRITWEFLEGEMAGAIMSVVSPPAAQTVAWSQPFIYKGPGANHSISVPIPADSTLPNTLTEADFVNRPAEYFEPGRETVWLQILNLDARMDSELGSIRIILGETLKREYPDIFQPSLGVAQSLGKRGFPAKLFFNPIAIIETPFGSFRATHGTLAYGRVVGFPPVGTPVTIAACVPMESVPALRAALKSRPKEREALLTGQKIAAAPARIISLSHPIDMAVQLPGDEAFAVVERMITNASVSTGTYISSAPTSRTKKPSRARRGSKRTKQS